jgi:hypothetical protein
MGLEGWRAYRDINSCQLPEQKDQSKFHPADFVMTLLFYDQAN